MDLESKVMELEAEVRRLRSELADGARSFSMWPSGGRPPTPAAAIEIASGMQLVKRTATTFVIRTNPVYGFWNTLMIDGKIVPFDVVGAVALDGYSYQFTPALASSGSRRLYVLVLQDKHPDSPVPAGHIVTLELIEVTNLLLQFQRKIVNGFRYRYQPVYQIVVDEQRILWGGAPLSGWGANTKDGRSWPRWDSNTWDEPTTQTVTVVTSVDPQASKVLTFKSGKLVSVT